MKRFAKSVLLQSIRILPLRARRAILEDLAKEIGTLLPLRARTAILEDLAKEIGTFKHAGDIARRVGVSGFVAEGDAGVIRGALDDDSIFISYAKYGTWSPRASLLFKNLFAERGGTYLDVGANIGLTLIPIAQNPEVQCYAFEPEPTNFRYLCENVSLNCRAGNVRLFNFALYDRNASLPFELAERHSGDHRISLTDAGGEMDEHHRQKISVLAKRLDDVIADVAEPIAVKIDVQGAEPFVFAGGRRLLSQARLLSLEFWPYSMRRMGGDISTMIAFLAEHFQEGSISPGPRCYATKDEQAIWQPIASVAAFLREFPNTGSDDYLDVTVRKV